MFVTDSVATCDDQLLMKTGPSRPGRSYQSYLVGVPVRFGSFWGKAWLSLCIQGQKIYEHASRLNMGPLNQPVQL